MNLNRICFRFFRLLAAALLAQRAAASPAPGDEHWSTQFGWPGTTNFASAITTHHGRLYASGGTVAGTTTTINIWDGTQWSRFGQIVGPSGASVYDLAFVGETLYVAGFFTNIDGVAIRGLARWDGTSWSDLGLTNGTVVALAVDGSDLYAGGVFKNPGGVSVTNVGRWDGSAWHALGPGLGGTNTVFSDVVRALVVTNGIVYAAGNFSNSGSQPVSHIAAWDGAGWSSIGGGISGTTVYGLAWDGSGLHAAGLFSQAGATPVSNIARWDGANWSALGSGLNGGVNSLAILGDAVFAAGSFTTAGGLNATNVAAWNGSSWSPVGGGLSATGFRAFSTGTNLYAGGNFLAAGGGIMNQIALWEGDQWHAVGPAERIGGLSSTVRSIASDGSNLIAGGSFSYAGQATNTIRVARYDGTHWRAFGSGLNDTVSKVAVVGTNVYAAGDFTGGSGGPFAYHMARWNGSQWVDLNNTAFGTVSALGVRSNDLFVAGYFGIAAADGTASWLTRWDGTNFWKVEAFEPLTFTAFYLDGIGYTAMAIQETNIYLSGHFMIGRCDDFLTVCTNCSNVMRFDGTYGRLMGTGLNSNATAIAVLGANVYFAGPFTNAGGVTANRIAKWDGEAWSGVGGGVVGSGTINALAVIGTNLYAGGTFTNIGNVPASRIARWDGGAWSPLGSGTAFNATAGPVLALTAVGEDLYVGGTFRSAGGKDSYYMARWNETLNFNVSSLRFSGTTGNPSGPFQTTLTAIGVPAYVIEVSTNLPLWRPLLTNSLTPYDLMDSTAPATPRRFYRARSQP